jgi:HTH-type transcriptional regulator/antitoxin HigA
MEIMSTTVGNLDLSRYGRLLARTVPRVIKTEEENERALAIVESLMSKGERNLSPEEDALLELLAGLIGAFEEKAYPIPRSAPHELLAFLLDQRGLTAKELWPVVGSKSRGSEILAGKRGTAKEQAKRLAEFFHLDVGLFL